MQCFLITSSTFPFLHGVLMIFLGPQEMKICALYLYYVINQQMHISKICFSGT